MTQGYQALTDKEKQTLRLLVDGYDAKTMARHLGLSVHTVNERLRDARRKMATSSSREAARQLREAERCSPELLGDRPLGDALFPDACLEPEYQTGRRGANRRTGWIAGGLVMSFGLALLAYAALSGGAQNAVPAPAAASAESVTVTAARRWLALVDSGNWPDSWQATAQSFRALNTLAVWQSASEGGRVPLGAMLSRSLLDELDVPVPPAGAQVVRFRTDFANKPGALEKISLVREDGGWKVVGYTIE